MFAPERAHDSSLQDEATVIVEAASPRTLDDPIVFAHRLATLVCEICTDRRPVDQIGPWVSEQVHQQLSRRVALLRQSSRSSVQGATRLGDIVVGAHRFTQPSANVAEFCAIVRIDGRTRAITIVVKMYPFGPRAIAIELI